MLNIFNLFLFLFALWILFMISAGNISWLYLGFGIIASGLVSTVSYRLNLIEEKSELLYLSFGFYRHFLRIYLSNFFAAIKLIVRMAFNREPIKPIIYITKFNHHRSLNIAILTASINMTTGLFYIGMRNEDLLIHAIDSDHFKKFDLQKTLRALIDINDDNLV